MGFREVSVVEVREVLRAWLEGHGLRTVAERAGVDRKTARRYVEAAQAAGLARDAGAGAVDRRAGRAGGRGGPPGPAERARRGVGGAARPRGADPGLGRRVTDEEHEPLSIVKIEELLARQGVRGAVPDAAPVRASSGAGSGSARHHGAGRRRGAGGGVPDRLRPDGPARRPGDRAAAEGARVDLHRGAVAAHVRVADVTPRPWPR